MTNRDDRSDATDRPESTDRKTMADVDHTHPYGDPSLHEVFRRGEAVAADGGRRAAADGDDDRTMDDVDHEGPDEVDGAARTFGRGPDEA